MTNDIKSILHKAWGENLGVMDYEYQNDIYDPSLIAIFLSANSANYQRLLALESFTRLLLGLELSCDLYGIKQAQIASLHSISKYLVSKDDVLYHLKELEIIDERMIFADFVRSCEQKTISTNAKQASLAYKSATLEQLDLLEQLVDDTRSIQELRQKFLSNEFRVIVSGVLNSGKSSFINALIKKDLLGVSNVPQTANMTTLKFSQTPPSTALVEYWDKDEWESIKQACQASKATSEILSKANQNLIKNDKNTATIPIASLQTQSGASFDDAVLIKQITICDDSEFLRGGVVLCDTPGLDDVIIARELLSIKQAKKADVLLHLSNCTQSLASKDMEFLSQCLGANTSLVVVLTKADLIEPSELASVKSYAANRLKQALGDIDLHVFAISSKSGFGMDMLENFLFGSLFARQQTSLLSRTKANIMSLANSQINLLKQHNTELNMLANKQLAKLSEHKEQLAAKLAELNALEQKAKNIDIVCDTSLRSPFSMLAKSLSIKIIDNISYSKSRITSTTFISSALSDALSDIARDIYTKNTALLSQAYASLGLDIQPSFEIKDMVLEFKDSYMMKILPLVLGVLDLPYDHKDISATQLLISSKLSEIFASFDRYDGFDISKAYDDMAGGYFASAISSIRTQLDTLSMQDSDDIAALYQRNQERIDKLQTIINWCDHDN